MISLEICLSCLIKTRMSPRYIFITIFIFAFLFSSYDEDISTAINQLYNFEINEVINTLEKIAVSYPEDPLIPFLRLSAYWQHSLLYDNPESSYEVIENGVRQAIPFYVDMIEKYPDEQKYNLFLGSLYGLKARVDLAQSDWMGLIVSGSRGFRYISEAIEEDPYLYDAYMPIGTLEYFLCRSNSALQMIGKLFGLKSDCKEAVRKLELSSNNAEYSWVEAKNVLSYIYLYIERDYVKAYNVSNSLTQSFPGHPFFLYLEAESLIKLKDYEEFNKIDNKLVKFYKEGPINQQLECYDKYIYLNALKSFQDKNYNLAIKFSSEVINNYDIEFKWVLGYSHLIRGKSFELMGNRTIAIADYKKAIKYLDNYPDQADAQLLVKSPIPEIPENR